MLQGDKCLTDGCLHLLLIESTVGLCSLFESVLGCKQISFSLVIQKHGNTEKSLDPQKIVTPFILMMAISIMREK